MRSGGQVFQESGFASSSLSCKKNMAGSAINKLDSGGHAISFGYDFFSRIHRVKVKQLCSKVSIKKQSDFPGDFFGILCRRHNGRFSAETTVGICAEAVENFRLGSNKHNSANLSTAMENKFSREAGTYLK